MPPGEGWWLNLVTGKAVPIYEHAHHVKTNPKLFRLRPEDVKDLLPGVEKDRIQLVKLGMRQGWARIRAHGPNVVVEFDWPNLDDALAYIIAFLSDSFGQYTQVEIHDIHRHKNYSSRLSDLTDPERLSQVVGAGVAESRKLADLLRRLMEAS